MERMVMVELTNILGIMHVRRSAPRDKTDELPSHTDRCKRTTKCGSFGVLRSTEPYEFYSTDGLRLRMYNETPYDASHRL